MNTVSGNSSSMASLATSVFGNARQAFKAMAEAAANVQPDAEAGAAQQAGRRGARRGVALDRYL